MTRNPPSTPHYDVFNIDCSLVALQKLCACHFKASVISIRTMRIEWMLPFIRKIGKSSDCLGLDQQHCWTLFGTVSQRTLFNLSLTTLVHAASESLRFPKMNKDRRWWSMFLWPRPCTNRHAVFTLILDVSYCFVYIPLTEPTVPCLLGKDRVCMPRVRWSTTLPFPTVSLLARPVICLQRFILTRYPGYYLPISKQLRTGHNLNKIANISRSTFTLRSLLSTRYAMCWVGLGEWLGGVWVSLGEDDFQWVDLYSKFWSTVVWIGWLLDFILLVHKCSGIVSTCRLYFVSLYLSTSMRNVPILACVGVSEESRKSDRAMCAWMQVIRHIDHPREGVRIPQAIPQDREGTLSMAVSEYDRTFHETRSRGPLNVIHSEPDQTCKLVSSRPCFRKKFACNFGCRRVSRFLTAAPFRRANYVWEGLQCI